MDHGSWIMDHGSNQSSKQCLDQFDEKYNKKYIKKNKIMLRKFLFSWIMNNDGINSFKYNFNIIILCLVNSKIAKLDVIKYCYNLKGIDITKNRAEYIKFTKSLINLERFNCDLNNVRRPPIP